MLTPVHDTLHEPWTTQRLFEEGLEIQTEGRHSIRIESSMSHKRWRIDTDESTVCSGVSNLEHRTSSAFM